MTLDAIEMICKTAQQCGHEAEEFDVADVLALVDRLRKAEAVCEYMSGTYVGHRGHHLLQEWRAKREAIAKVRDSLDGKT